MLYGRRILQEAKEVAKRRVPSPPLASKLPFEDEGDKGGREWKERGEGEE